MSPNELYSEIDRLNRELTASQAEVDKARRERDDETAEVVRLTKERDDRIRLLGASNVDRLRIVGIFQEVIGALVVNGYDVRRILGAELEEQVHGIVELEQPAKGETRDELRVALAAALSAKEKAESDLCIAFNDAHRLIAHADAATAALAEAKRRIAFLDNAIAIDAQEADAQAERATKAEKERDAAREDARRAREALGLAYTDCRVLAHAYQHDERPPSDVLERCWALPVNAMDAVDSALSPTPEAQGCDGCARESCAGYNDYRDNDCPQRATPPTPQPARETTDLCVCDAPECLYYNGECNAPCLGTVRARALAAQKEGT